jgi:hypothetical protein
MSSLKDMLQTRRDNSVMDLMNSFKGLSIDPNYNSSRDGALGVPPFLNSSKEKERSSGSYNAAGYTQYNRRGGVSRKYKKSRKSRKSRKNKRSKRYRKK